VIHLMNNSVLVYDDFRFICTSDPGGKLSPNFCVSYTYWNIITGDINRPAALQLTVTVIFSLFSSEVKT
jgi:hypothetical protein